MKESTKYTYIDDGEAMQFSLMPWHNFFACCGCGLVHVHDYKLRRDKNGAPVLFGRVTSDNRRTAAIRRHKKELHKTKQHYVAVFPRRERAS